MTPTKREGRSGAVFCDTSVLVAAMYPPHELHARSRAVAESLVPKEGSCALHSLAECYAVLTRMPGSAPAASDVRTAIGLIRQLFVVVPLGPDDYDHVLDDLASRRMIGGIVYDAVILRAAARIRPTVIYTWNERHFRRVAPALADIIRAPA